MKVVTNRLQILINLVPIMTRTYLKRIQKIQCNYRDIIEFVNEISTDTK